MTLSIRGTALGAAMFAIYLFVSLAILVSRVERANPSPGQHGSFDLVSMATHTFGAPMFWVTLVVMFALGNIIVSLWKR
jgi:hypothetical protein